MSRLRVVPCSLHEAHRSLKLSGHEAPSGLFAIAAKRGKNFVGLAIVGANGLDARIVLLYAMDAAAVVHLKDHCRAAARGLGYRACRLGRGALRIDGAS